MIKRFNGIDVFFFFVKTIRLLIHLIYIKKRRNSIVADFPFAIFATNPQTTIKSDTIFAIFITNNLKNFKYAHIWISYVFRQRIDFLFIQFVHQFSFFCLRYTVLSHLRIFKQKKNPPTMTCQCDAYSHHNVEITLFTIDLFSFVLRTSVATSNSIQFEK